MAKQSISKEVKAKVLEIVEAFNKEHKTHFQMTFRRQFAYLAKVDTTNHFRQMIARKLGLRIELLSTNDAPIVKTKLGRLEYNGQMDNWDFAVFKYSREVYDTNEWVFPGSSKLDGTIEGALRAGVELY